MILRPSSPEPLATTRGALGFFFRFDLGPEAFDLFRCQIGGVAKNMRMAANKLACYRKYNIVKPKKPLFFCKTGMKCNLKQKVTQLFT